MHDIHSQPNIFSKSLIKYNYKINKFDVVFNKKFRGFGSGNNDTFLKK